MKKLDELGISSVPWEVLKQGGRNKPSIVFGGRHGEPFTAEVFGYAPMTNARLIAAAPDLYESLRDCLRQLEYVSYIPKLKDDREIFHWDYIIDNAKKALEKAGGAE